MRRILLCALVSIAATEAEGIEVSAGGSLETTLWIADGVPPAFIEFDDDALLDPRLSLTVDLQLAPDLLLHGKVRIDRGFDPGTRPDGQLRLDELALLYRPLGDQSLKILIGKFPTIVGNWVPSHAFEDDPFLLPPLPYGAINGINVNDPADNSAAAIAARSQLSGATIHRQKENWSSVIWGPAYSNGLSVFGSGERLDYAFEIKNASLGSQPSEWGFGEGDFRRPTVSGRIGFRPNAAWAFGLSASRGHYLNAGAVLPAGADRDDFKQSLIGLDLRWAHRDWVVSGEAFFTRYHALHEDFDSFSYYLQARYKAAPGLWFAGRFGQTLSNSVPVPGGGTAPWSPDLVRAELSLGWRITPDLLLKTQYARTVVTNDLSEPSQNLGAVSIGWRF